LQARLTISFVKSVQPLEKVFEIYDTDIKGFLLRVLPTGTMTYFLSYRNDAGKRNRCKIGNHGNVTATQARDEAAKFAGRVAHGEDIQRTRKQARIESEKDQVNRWGTFLELKYEQWANTHLKTGRETVNRLKACFSDLQTLRLNEIDHEVIDSWRSERIESGRKFTTINRDVTALKSALSKAVEWNILDIHPLAGLKPLKTDDSERVRWLDPEEERRLREALDKREAAIKTGRSSCNAWRRQRGYEQYPELWDREFADHLKPMVLLTLNTGLRRGELFSLEWSRVNFQTKQLTAHWTIAKSSKTRHIPLNPEALSVLLRWREQSCVSKLVFPSENGKPFTGVKTSWSGLLVDSKITNFWWHDMRHHFASQLVMKDVSLYVVQKLLGHADIKTTERYAHLSPGKMADAVALLAS